MVIAIGSDRAGDFARVRRRYRDRSLQRRLKLQVARPLLPQTRDLNTGCCSTRPSRRAKSRACTGLPVPGLSGPASRGLPMRQITEPLRGFVPVVPQDRVDGLALLGRQRLRITLRPLRDLEHAAMETVERRHHGAVHPGLDTVLEHRLLVPDERPCLRVVDQLLQLHGGHLALPAQDVGCYVVSRRHLLLLGSS